MSALTPDEKISAAAATLDPKDFEAFIRHAADDFYERLLSMVQTHLRDNAEWNLSAEIDHVRNAARHAEQQLAEISDALGVSQYSQEARIGRIEVLKARGEQHA